MMNWKLRIWNSRHLLIHEMIREQIYLALPMKFLCNVDCRGLCPNCGANLNEVECECASGAVGSALGIS